MRPASARITIQARVDRAQPTARERCRGGRGSPGNCVASALSGGSVMVDGSGDGRRPTQCLLPDPSPRPLPEAERGSQKGKKLVLLPPLLAGEGTGVGLANSLS